MKRPQARQTVVAGPAGALQTLVEAPENPVGIAVICHPHPLYQGTMTNKVAHTLARVFNDLGFVAVRFNFRGVGDSAGTYDEAVGETEDALAIRSWAESEWPGLPLWMAGFSFGAFVALRSTAVRLPDGLVSVAIPVQRFDVESQSQPQCPWIIVQGDQDELVDAAAVVDWVNALEPGPELVVLDGVDHFFHGRLRQLREILHGLIGRHLGERSNNAG
ncbi:MAG: alpha/beta hydrolase [Gammaproteobacteria bacterium]|nr:alpha/beta hydrolase [Gammaproteobacteria bacterium]NND59069.1 alpha/beta hydrolase [Gammaproteobacteria bacterium]